MNATPGTPHSPCLRFDLAIYVSRFPSNDLVYKCFESVVVAGMLIMTLYVESLGCGGWLCVVLPLLPG